MNNALLIIHNVGFIISALAAVGICTFFIINKPRSRARIMFGLTSAAVLTFVVSHVVGVNVADPYVSRTILMFNVSTIFIGVFNVHAVLALLGKDKERRYLLWFIYLSATAFSVWLLVNPSLLWEPSVPKMYFPNYYNPGPLNVARILFMYIACVPYFLAELFMAYRRTDNHNTKKQFKYLFIGFIIGYGTGFFPNFLVFDIRIDPIWGMACMTLFFFFFFYAMVRYELLDIRIIAKKAIGYAVAIIAIGGIITVFNLSNRWLDEFYPNFPFWVIPLVSSTLTVLVSIAVWRKLREEDILKYEFITTVAHKFRTPLTHIKWASENLSRAARSADEQKQLDYIQSSNAKLVELTDTLMGISENSPTSYEYNVKKIDISALTQSVVDSLKNQAAAKNISLTTRFEDRAYGLCDVKRLSFVVQTIIENAIQYTPDGGSAVVIVNREGETVVFTVHDTGIGISKRDMPFIFTKFYRGTQARLADTEGMGLGLSISQNIIANHNGKIWVSSDGPDKGSTFGFSIPAAQ